jgi:hypothetical protein
MIRRLFAHARSKTSLISDVINAGSSLVAPPYFSYFLSKGPFLFKMEANSPIESTLIHFFSNTSTSIRKTILVALLSTCTADELISAHRTTTRLICKKPKLELPEELWFLIFQSADTKSLYALSRVNKRFNALLSFDNHFWHQRCIKSSIRTPHESPILKRRRKIIVSPKLFWAPWKTIYSNEMIARRNWKLGRYNLETREHPAGSLCFFFDDRHAVTVTFGQGNLYSHKSGHLRYPLGAITTARFDKTFLFAGNLDMSINIYKL